MKVSISFLGDISLNDDYIKLYNQNKKPFNVLNEVLRTDDYVIGNLECIAKGDQGENLAKKPRLSTTLETLNYLNQIPVNIVSLAQNHIYDHLEDGFEKTTKFLSQNNIQFLGSSSNKGEENIPLVLLKNDIRIGLLNYVSHDTNPNLPENAKIYTNIFNLNKTTTDIDKIKGSVDHIVILLHWGGRVEGGLYPDWDQPNIAKRLIDAGADLIIGHHSHTIQPFEQYKNKYIFYSLGNFCFSNYTFEQKFYPMPLRRMITPIVSVEFEKKSYRVNIKYYKNNLDYYTPITYSKNMRIRNTVFSILKKNKWLWNVYFFNKKKILPFKLFMLRDDLTLKVKLERIFKSLFK